MLISKIYYAIIDRFERICNTFYYAFGNRKDFVVINALIYQLFDKVFDSNIGDDLNAVIISKLSGKKVMAYRSFYHFSRPVDNLMVIGSTINWMGNDHTTVWGAGFLDQPVDIEESKTRYSLKEVCAVRGEKTRECLLRAGFDCPEVYGDPALLMPLLYRPSVTKVKGRVGIIPHYVDLDNVRVKRLLNELGDDGVLIPTRFYKNWRDVIDLISSCEFVLSSSLHGLILSDAYGIPNQWVRFSELISGGSFKYEDYYSSVKKDARVVAVDDRMTVSDILHKATPYQRIVFDPKPLLKACPFEITHSEIVKLLSGQI